MLGFRNGEVYKDRKEAGIKLGKILAKRYKDKNVLVLGIPRGGVEVAYYVAEELNEELSVLVSKKLPYPGQEEYAFGAVAEDGSYFLSSAARRLDEFTIKNTIKNQLAEIERRVQIYRSGKPLPQIKNRIVIIVDDGIATGSTLVPALKLCKAKQAAKLVVAAPVSGDLYIPEIDELADEVVIANNRKTFLRSDRSMKTFMD